MWLLGGGLTARFIDDTLENVEVALARDDVWEPAILQTAGPRCGNDKEWKDVRGRVLGYGVAVKEQIYR